MLAEKLNKGDYFTIFHMTFGYHHIVIHPEHHKFQSLEWTFKDSSTRYSQFCVLSFGLVLACHILIKVLWPLTKRQRESGIKVIIFIGDCIAAFQCFEITKCISELVRNDLFPAGFVIINEKTDFSPKAKEEWLCNHRHQRINFYRSTGKYYKTFRESKQVFKSRIFDPKTIIKGSRITFFYAFGNRSISLSFYQKHVSFH